jgi:hypothetical protein
VRPPDSTQFPSGERCGGGDWSDWVSATDTYHWSDRNPLIDWLNAFGPAAGFVADSHRPNYDKRFDGVDDITRARGALEPAQN